MYSILFLKLIIARVPERCGAHRQLQASQAEAKKSAQGEQLYVLQQPGRPQYLTIDSADSDWVPLTPIDVFKN